jgi:hypothetical protein
MGSRCAPYDVSIDSKIDENTKLTDCYYEKKDWRACKQEVSRQRTSEMQLFQRFGPRYRRAITRSDEARRIILTDFSDGGLSSVLATTWERQENGFEGRLKHEIGGVLPPGAYAGKCQGACLLKAANSVRTHDRVLVVWYCWSLLNLTAHFVQTHVIFRRMRQEAVRYLYHQVYTTSMRTSPR